MPDEMEYESKVAGLDPSATENGVPNGQPNGQPNGHLSGFTCPDCSGPLYETHDGKLLRFRCRVGHAYTADSILDEKTEALESAALYVALNTLEESAAMAERLAESARGRRHEHAAARFEQRAQRTRDRATVIRRVLAGEIPNAPADVLADVPQP